jgi:hypothetical protein
MDRTEKNGMPQSWLMSVLTDIHFWVPVVILVAGLLLLKSIH